MKRWTGERRPKSMVFYGMSATYAMKKYAGGVLITAPRKERGGSPYRGSVDETDCRKSWAGCAR